MQGTFTWFELMTTDLAAAERFYADVVGWSPQDAGMPDRRYSILSAGDAPVGGMMALAPEMIAGGARPGWMGYISVDDVDAMVAKLVAVGGSVHRPADDIPGVGRFAVVADPHGAVFILFRGAMDPAPPLPQRWAPGSLGWAELHAGDGPQAFEVYSKLFGWTKGDAIDMGPMGVYQLFESGGEAIGGMMTKMPQTPAPFWLYYICTPDITAAMARVTAAGGQVVHGPQEVPGGAWIINCVDPQGAMFALVGQKSA